MRHLWECKYIFISMIDRGSSNSYSTTISKRWISYLSDLLLQFHLWSRCLPLPLLSIPHQLWHSCLEENRFLLPPQPLYTNGLHSPEWGWKYQSRTYSEQTPSDIGSRQRPAVTWEIKRVTTYKWTCCRVTVRCAATIRGMFQHVWGVGLQPALFLHDEVFHTLEIK